MASMERALADLNLSRIPPEGQGVTFSATQTSPELHRPRVCKTYLSFQYILIKLKQYMLRYQYLFIS